MDSSYYAFVDGKEAGSCQAGEEDEAEAAPPAFAYMASADANRSSQVYGYVYGADEVFVAEEAVTDNPTSNVDSTYVLDVSGSTPYPEEKVYRNVEQEEAEAEKTTTKEEKQETKGARYSSAFTHDEAGRSSNKNSFMTLFQGNVSDKVLRTSDWNRNYQSLLTMTDSRFKFSLLGELAQDFNYAASIYGMIIINEINLPNEKKTLKPVSIGGVAGGAKYIANGILFKLRGVISIYSCNIPKLLTPLMCLVDYKGFRLIAISLLPITRESLAYGSADGAATVVNNHDEASDLAGTLGARLNLKPHKAGARLIEMAACADLEIHRVKDQYYAIDAARLFPPQGKLPGHKWQKGDMLCRLLRPEHVLSNPVPLCSDAFSGFQMHDPDRAVHNREVTEATHRLMNEAIPALAAFLLTHSKAITNKDMTLNQEFHRKGVNMRHLGLVRYALSKLEVTTGRDDVMQLLLREMILRVVKNFMRRQMRQRMVQILYPRDEPFKQIVVGILNLIVGKSDPEASSTFWSSIIFDGLVNTYGIDSLTPAEQSSRNSFARLINIAALVKLFCAAAGGISLASDVLEEFEMMDELINMVFTSSDIASINPKVKQMGITYTAQAMAYHLSAEDEEDTELKARLWKKADATFAKAISVVSNTRTIDMQWAGLLYELAKNEGGHGATSYLTKADKKYEMLAAFAPDAEIFANWGNLHLLWAEHRAFSSWSAASKQAHYNTCIEKWEMAIKLSSTALNSIYLTIFKPGQGSALADLLNVIANSNTLIANLKSFISTHDHYPNIDLRSSRITDAGLRVLDEINISVTHLNLNNCTAVTGRALVYLHHRSQLRILRLPVPCASITYRDVELLVQQLPYLELLIVGLTTVEQRKIETLRTRRVENLRVLAPVVLEAHDQAGDCIALLPNGDIATSSWDERVKIWHPSNEGGSASSRNWTCIGNFKQNRSDPDDEVMVSSLIVRNNHLYSGYSGRVAVWDIVGGREVAVWTKQKELVHLMVLKKNRLYTCSWDDTICIYDINADPVNPPLIAQTKIKTNYGNAEGLAVDDENISNPIFYWTAQSMLCVRALRGQPKPKIYACTSSEYDTAKSIILDGDRIYTSGYDKAISIWDKNTMSITRKLLRHKSHIEALQTALGLLYSADSGGTVLVWRLDTLECIAELEVAFTRISSMLVGSGLIYCYGSRDKKACLEILSHSEVHRIAGMGSAAELIAHLHLHPEDLDVPDYYTPLHVSAQRGEPDILNILLKSGADPHKTTLLGQTASQILAICEAEAVAGADQHKTLYFTSCRAYLDTRLALSTAPPVAIPVDYDTYAQANLDELLASLS